ncbi:MAG: 5-(carboxyamino)imidazole ribonucleotide mutase [Deltaproteobacteria bacterium]|nr:5-(carboxyamino)imidazole ribonucleotide mutase [Deltaproteobacteria bacterium]
MGSDSDWEVMSQAARRLEAFGVGCDVHVLSAHRTPRRTAAYAASAAARGIRVFICGAGGAAHLAGAVAAHTPLPVIGVPLDSSSLQGLDALLATVQMPKGVPVATVAVGAAGAENAAILAAQILALCDARLAARLVRFKRQLERKAVAADRKLRKKGSGVPPA